jgi:hypothetical protein
MSRVLDVKLIEAYLRLDTDQMVSKKIRKQFEKVVQSLSAPH